MKCTVTHELENCINIVGINIAPSKEKPPITKRWPCTTETFPPDIIVLLSPVTGNSDNHTFCECI